MSNTGEIRAVPDENMPLMSVPQEQTEPTPTTSGSVVLPPPDRSDLQRLDGAHQAQQMQQKGPVSANRKSSTPSTGVAFSGGGIRSAAFCSGVLRWMLQRSFPMDYLSCVSGGGYTGAAFLDWKYHNKDDEDSKWQKKFFEQMHQNAGYLCNWQTPLIAILQSLLLIFFVFFTVVFLPCWLWLPYALPVAEAVDFLFGDMLRESSSCDGHAQSASDVKNAKTSYLLLELYGTCSPSYKRLSLFIVTALFSLVFYVISRSQCCLRFKGHLRMFSTFCGLLFVLTAVPWIAHDFLWPIQAWVQVVIFFIALILPFFLPIIRNYAGIFLFFYFYAFVVSWKVFKIELLGMLPYSDAVFYPALVTCCAMIVFFPLFGPLHRTLFNTYYRRSLSNAFFNVAASFKLKDVFPCCGTVFEGANDQYTLFRKGHLRDVEEKELTLYDLKDVEPKFISNITVNDWQIDSRNGPCHHLMAFSTEDVKIIGKYMDDEGKIVKPKSFKFKPEHMRLTHAMAISGAAVSFDMGSYESRLDMVLDLLSLLGLGMGAEMASDQVSLERDKEKPLRKSCTKVLISILLEVLVSFPLFAIVLCYVSGSKTDMIAVLVLVHIVILVLLSLVAVQNTGLFDEETCCKTGLMSSVLRWLIPRLFFVRFLRGFLNIPHVSTTPPPLLRLSDGGHFENLALLPLLEKKLDYIVVADGSCNSGGEAYADALLLAIKTAREKLHCSFSPSKAEGNDEVRDIEEDIRVHFLTKKHERFPRHYRFKVYYYDTDENGCEIFSGKTGEILFLAPRHPSECKPLTEQPGPQKKWEDFNVTKEDLERKKDDKIWTEKPRVMTEEEANSLTWCCCQHLHGSVIKETQETRGQGRKLLCCACRCTCDCCPGDICHTISSRLLGGFPHHITANQFFTPDMFSAYHREGLAACIEAEDQAQAFFQELHRRRNEARDQTSHSVAGSVTIEA